MNVSQTNDGTEAFAQLVNNLNIEWQVKSTKKKINSKTENEKNKIPINQINKNQEGQGCTTDLS